MKKYAFLAALEKELNKEPNYKDLISYYQELIEEAVFNGEDEEAFIKGLGSPAEIYYRLKKDDVFVENIKGKKDFSATQVFSTTTKIISYFIYIIYIVVLWIITISFIIGGASGIVQGGIETYFIVSGGGQTNELIYVAFSTLSAIGVLLIGWALIQYTSKYASKQFKQLQLGVKNKMEKKGKAE